MQTNNPKFSINDLPIAYFNDNKKSNAMRNQLIKNQVRIPEDEQNNLEEFFFSDENMNIINKQLVLSVYNKTNGKYRISYQSKESLVIVMRYVFLEYAKHLPYDIANQIRELNCKVVSEILPNIITNVSQKIGYLNEINKPRELLPLPMNVNKNNKNLAPVTNIFNDNPSKVPPSSHYSPVLPPVNIGPNDFIPDTEAWTLFDLEYKKI